MLHVDIYVPALENNYEFSLNEHAKTGVVIEEIAYKNSWIDKEQLLKSADSYGKSEYGKHLRKVAEDKRYSDRKI